MNRLKTARGRLDAVLRMVEADAYCPDVMKQLSGGYGPAAATEEEVHS